MVYKKKTRKITKRSRNKHRRVTKRRHIRGGDANMTGKERIAAAEKAPDPKNMTGDEKMAAANEAAAEEAKKVADATQAAAKGVREANAKAAAAAKKAGEEAQELAEQGQAALLAPANAIGNVVGNVTGLVELPDDQFSVVAEELSNKLDILENAAEEPIDKLEKKLEHVVEDAGEDAGHVASKVAFGALSAVPGLGAIIAMGNIANTLGDAASKGAESFDKVATDLNDTIDEVEDKITTLEAHKDAATGVGLDQVNALKGRRDELHAKTTKHLDDATEHLGEYTPHPTKDNHLIHADGKEMHKDDIESHKNSISKVQDNIAKHAAKKKGETTSQNGGRIRRILKSRRDFYDTNKTRSNKGKISHNKSVKR